MNKIVGGAFAVGLTTCLVAASLVVQAEPLVLTNYELDTVTAGEVIVGVTTIAEAMGENATTFADTETRVFSSPLFELGSGVGVGRALACCGPSSDVDVETSVFGQGDGVQGGTLSVEHDNGVWAEGYTWGWVVAFALPSPEKSLREDTQVLHQYGQRIIHEFTQGVEQHALALADSSISPKGAP